MSEKIIMTNRDFTSSPLSPVLPWCREMLEKEQINDREELIENWGLSPSHRSLFLDYFSHEIPYRDEEILFGEKEYDRRHIHNDLWIIFCSLMSKNQGDYHIILYEEFSLSMKIFMDYLEKMAGSIDQKLTFEYKGELMKWDCFSQLPSYKSKNKKSDHDLFKQAMTFHAFGDHLFSSQICEILYQKSRKGNLTLNIQQRASLFISYGKSSMNLRLTDTALTIFNSLMNLGKAWENREYIAESYRLTGLVYWKNGYDKTAIRFLKKSLDESEKNDGTIYRFRALFSLIQLGNRGILTREEEEESLTLARKWKMVNSEIILKIFCSQGDMNRVYKSLINSEEPLLLAEFYFRRGKKNHKGINKSSEGDYKNSLQLGEKINNSRIINRAHDALGQFYLERGDYIASFSQLKKAQEGYLKAESYVEMAKIYQFLARLALLLFKPKICLSYLSSSHYILKGLTRLLPEWENINDDLTDLAGLLDSSLSPRNSINVGTQRIGREIYTNFFHMEDQDETLILEQINIWSNTIPYEGAKLSLLILAIQLRPNRNNKLLKKAITEGKPPKGEMRPLTKAILKGEKIPLRCRWLKEPLDKELVASSFKQYRRLEQLKRRMHEINLLSTIQTIFSQKLERDILLLQTMECLLTSFLVNKISYYEKLENSYRLAYHSSTFDEQPDRTLLDEYLKHPMERNQSEVIRGYLCIPICTDSHIEGIIIGQMEGASMNSEENDIQFFSILAAQFGSALDQIRQRDMIMLKNKQLEEINKELTQTSLTDPLTGIGNRMQLDDRIVEYTKRYGGFREGDNFTLMFIDLDFFKIYNDTYGHAMGDKLLSEFTDLLKTACRESDGIFRYGGDEFILLLGGISSEQAIPIANRIIEDMEKKKGFEELIREMGHKGPLVIRDKWLSCSIGISDFVKADKDPEQLLEQSDKAVYDAKKQGKKQWIIYNKGDNNE